ncbi:MAG: polyhydroxyalkanoate depolymerase [Alphaproteobacteria bacterium]|nr:polyhydroxyalkanoate depolymerase [Alphaproteobacteria bacterium]
MLPVSARQRLSLPFATAVELTHDGVAAQPPLLVVPPLSAHLPILLRDLVAGLLNSAPVVVLHWREAGRVPLNVGRFGFDDNVLHIEAVLRDLGPDTVVVALCQAVVPSLAAAARIAAESPPAAPRGLVLIAGPVDPLANPTRVVRLLRARTLDWFAANVITTVAPSEPGAGRRIYPASAQRTALLAYLARHLGQGGELSWKVFYDDGLDPYGHPFLTLFLSLMDLPADLFLENIATVFHDRAICAGTLHVAGRPIDLTALRRTALLTIEGEHDDIAAPGQTEAAHRLCSALPAHLHHRLLVKGSGHFSLFYGRTWRRDVLPAIERFDCLTRETAT